MNLWQYVEQSGLVGYILVGLDVVALGVVLERFIYWFVCSKSLSSTEQLKTLENLSQGKDYILGLSPKNQAYKALQMVINNPQISVENAQEVAVTKAVRETSKFNPILDTLAAVAHVFRCLSLISPLIVSLEDAQ